MGNNSSTNVRIVKGGLNQIRSLFQESELVALVFVRPGCRYCSELTPILIKQAQKFLVAVIDTQVPANSDVVAMFNISQVPAVLLSQGSPDKVVFSFFGCHEDKIKKMVEQSSCITKNPIKLGGGRAYVLNCPQGHPLALSQNLAAPYTNNEYICDECKTLGKVQKNHQILHCHPCTYDLCPICLNKKFMTLSTGKLVQ